MPCSGCGGLVIQAKPIQYEAGDVLAQTMWAGNRTEFSPYSGRHYKGGNGKQVYVAPVDVQRLPHLFKRVVEVSDLAPDIEDVIAMAQDSQ